MVKSVNRHQGTPIQHKVLHRDAGRRGRPRPKVDLVELELTVLGIVGELPADKKRSMSMLIRQVSWRISADQKIGEKLIKNALLKLAAANKIKLPEKSSRGGLRKKG
jgi:hypothetical protein